MLKILENLFGENNEAKLKALQPLVEKINDLEVMKSRPIADWLKHDALERQKQLQEEIDVTIENMKEEKRIKKIRKQKCPLFQI